jgi:hypothetical protein
MGWVNPAQNMDGWQTLVNAVMNLLVAQNVRNFLTPENLLVSQEGRCYMELINNSIIRI